GADRAKDIVVHRRNCDRVWRRRVARNRRKRRGALAGRSATPELGPGADARGQHAGHAARVSAQCSGAAGRIQGAGIVGRRDGVGGGLMAFERQLDASRRATEAALAAVGPVGSMPAAERQRRELSAWLDKLRVELAVHHALVDQLRDLARSDPEAAEQYLEARVYPHYVDVLQPLIQGYQDVAERDLREALGVVSVALTDADRDNTVLTILAIALPLILGVFRTRTIAQPISELRDAADRLGAGDLTARVTDRASDEIGALAVDFNGMAERLQTATTSKTYVEDILRSM